MASKIISFKNNALHVDNNFELTVESEMWDGGVKMNNAIIKIDMRNKTKVQIQTEGKELLREKAKYELENPPPVYDTPTTFPDFNLTVEYNNG